MTRGPEVITSRKSAPEKPIHRLSPLWWTKPSARGVPGLKLREWKGQDKELVIDVMRMPWGFFDICEGIDDFDRTIQYSHKPQQHRGFLLAHKYRWVNYTKYRQAMYSTWIAVGVLLRDVLYFDGMYGLQVANDDPTVEYLFGRMVHAYKVLREKYGYALVPPLEKKRPDPSVSEMHVEGGGGAKAITGRGWSPGVGRSAGRVHLSELGEIRPASVQSILFRNLLPTVSRRPNARVWFETTPGVAGCPAHATWIASLEGKGRFAGKQGTAAFLEWWLDPTCVEMVPEGFERTEEELAYIAKLSGGEGVFEELATKDAQGRQVGNAKSGSFNPPLEITDANLQFRRIEMATTFEGSPRAFDSKFPPNPMGGWLGAENPQLPEEVLQPMLRGALADDMIPLHEEAGVRWMKDGPPDAGACYLITVDPKRPVEGADPAGICVWEVAKEGPVIEVGFWEGWDDPPSLALRIRDLVTWIRDSAEHYVEESGVWVSTKDGALEAERATRKRLLTPDELTRLKVHSPGDDPLAAVESNTDGVISVLLGDGFEDVILYHSRSTKSSHLGWYATAKLLKDATAFTIKGLRDGWLQPKSRGTITQAIAWDGSKKDRRVQTAGGFHHFERARCLLIAGHVATTRPFIPAKWEILPDRSQEAYIPIAQRVSSEPKKKPFNPLKPASSQ